jgi:hypothetical protein
MNPTINMNDLFAAVMAIDLEPIKAKLMHAESGEGWSPARADAVEKEYRRFLCLMKLYPEEDTAPQVDVDTMKYARDCQQTFGYFLHHYPYVGLGDEQDRQFRLDSGDRMRILYESTFSEAYPGCDAGSAPGQDYGMRFGIALQAGALTAWCASPGDRKAASNDATAWCASPGSKAAAANATAWCASPGTKAAGATAWCASPGAKGTAFAA